MYEIERRFVARLKDENVVAGAPTKRLELVASTYGKEQ